MPKNAPYPGESAKAFAKRKGKGKRKGKMGKKNPFAKAAGGK